MEKHLSLRAEQVRSHGAELFIARDRAL